MKRCPHCSQTYSDDLRFCLADGTPLAQIVPITEEETLVRPTAPAHPTIVQPRRRGVSPVFMYLSVGLLLLLFLFAGAFGLWMLWPRDNSVAANTEVSKKAANSSASQTPTPEKTPSPSPSPTATPPPANNEANRKAEQDAIERERQRLAEERRKLEEAKKNDAPDQTPAPPAVTDPGATRITFRRGSVGEAVPGIIAKRRTFVIRALAGQQLTARVRSAGGCVLFDHGSAATAFQTAAGDNHLTLINNCGEPARFRLVTTVR